MPSVRPGVPPVRSGLPCAPPVYYNKGGFTTNLEHYVILQGAGRERKEGREGGREGKEGGREGKEGGREWLLTNIGLVSKHMGREWLLVAK